MIRTRVLEANIVHHCVNRCCACNHGSPFADPYFMSELRLKKDLAALVPVLHTDFFCLQGGEPLLHPGIIDMIDIACDSGIAEKCGILTNGRLFPRMPEEFWKRCGERQIELRCSVYPNLPEDVLRLAENLATRFGVNYRPGRIGAFSLMFGDYPNGESFRQCPWKTCHTVHEGFFYICPISTFWPKQFMHLPEIVDGYCLETMTEEGLREFIERKTPLQSCRRCTGSQALQISWHECDTEEQWLKESTV